MNDNQLDTGNGKIEEGWLKKCAKYVNPGFAGYVGLSGLFRLATGNFVGAASDLLLAGTFGSWTAADAKKERLSDYWKYQAIGSALAVPAFALASLSSLTGVGVAINVGIALASAAFAYHGYNKHQEEVAKEMSATTHPAEESPPQVKEPMVM